MDFCERNCFEILNATFDSNINSELTLTSTLRHSVTDYTFMSVGLLYKLKGFTVF